MLISNSIFQFPWFLFVFSFTLVILCLRTENEKLTGRENYASLSHLCFLWFQFFFIFLQMPDTFLILSQFCYFYIFVKLTKVGVQMSRCCKKNHTALIQRPFSQKLNGFIQNGSFRPLFWTVSSVHPHHRPGWPQNGHGTELFLRASMLQTSNVNFQNTDSILNIHPGTPLLHNMKEEDIWTLYHECILCRPNCHFVQWKSRFDVFLLEFSCASLQIWVKSISALIQTRALLNHRIKV